MNKPGGKFCFVWQGCQQHGTIRKLKTWMRSRGRGDAEEWNFGNRTRKGN